MKRLKNKTQKLEIQKIEDFRRKEKNDRNRI